MDVPSPAAPVNDDEYPDELYKRADALRKIFVPNTRAELDRAFATERRNLMNKPQAPAARRNTGPGVDGVPVDPNIKREFAAASRSIFGRTSRKKEPEKKYGNAPRLRYATVCDMLWEATACALCDATVKDHGGGEGWWATLRIPDAMVVCTRCEKSSRGVPVCTYVARANALLAYKDTRTPPPDKMFARYTVAPSRPRGHAIDPGTYYELATRPCQFTGIPGYQNHIVNRTIVAGKTPREMLQDAGLDEFYSRMRRVAAKHEKHDPATGGWISAGVDPEYSIMRDYKEDLDAIRDRPHFRNHLMHMKTHFRVTAPQRERCRARMEEYAKYVPRLYTVFFRDRASIPKAPPEHHLEFLYKAYSCDPDRSSVAAAQTRLGTSYGHVHRLLRKMHEDRAPPAAVPPAPPPDSTPDATPETTPETTRAPRIPREDVSAVYRAYYDERGLRRRGATIRTAQEQAGTAYHRKHIGKHVKALHDALHGKKISVK
jgi:hypothetical protein